MATVSREHIGLLNDKITVTLTKEDYYPAFEKQLKDYAKKANIPGFRKGMVPSGMIKKMYGAGLYTEEVIKKVEQELNEYMGKEQLDIFAQPLPVDSDARQLNMNDPADYTFAFEIGLKPHIDINPENIQVINHKVLITEEIIAEEIADLQRRNSDMTEPESITGDENLLNLDFSETDAEGNELNNGVTKSTSLLVGQFTIPIRQELTGKETGYSFNLTLANAFDQSAQEAVAGNLEVTLEDGKLPEQYFKVTITKIGQLEKPELNDHFFSQAYPGKNIKTEEEFREAVKYEAGLRWDVQSRNQLHDQIYHRLVEDTQIELPESFLKRWIQNGEKTPKTAEEAEKEYPAFVNSLKWTLISNQLLKDYEIKVEPQEIREFAKQQLLGYLGTNTGSNEPWIETYIDSMIKEEKFLQHTFLSIQTNKLFNLLEGKVSIIDKEVSAEELMAMQHHHN